MDALHCVVSWNLQWLVFTSEAPHLLYYSHIPTSLVALLLSFFVFKNNKSLVTFLLLFISIIFSVWNFIDLIIWTNSSSQLIMFLWSLLYLLQALILGSAWFFSDAFLDTEGIEKLWKKIVMGVLLLPLIVLLPTTWNLSGFNTTNCEATQGILVNYFYFFQVVVLIWIFSSLIQRYRRTVSAVEKKKVLIFSLGILFFLMSFSWGNLLGSLTLQWGLEQFGLFGMPVFLVFLTYLIVKYQAFDVKLLGAQALVVSLVILTGSQLFFIKTTTNFVLTGVTLVLASLFGWFLVKSVKQEVKRKEELQELTQELAEANQELKRLDTAKSEFISIASHQLRTPLTAIRGYISLVLEGSYGRVIPTVQDVLNKVYVVNNRMGQLVEDLLNISRIESGRVQYSFVEAQLEPIVADTVDMFSLMAKTKNIALKIKLPKKSLPKLMLDTNKIREVVSNLIDNAIKYTKEGSVTVSVENAGDAVLVKVIDTGIGVSPETASRLFEKFTRSSETMKLDVSGTGLGLYVGKNFVEAHGGILSVESEGPGKGACFIIKLPIKQQKLVRK